MKMLLKLLLELVEKSDVDITEEDISKSHRLPLKRGNSNSINSRHSLIIVRYLSRRKKKRKFYTRFNTKHLTTIPLIK